MSLDGNSFLGGALIALGVSNTVPEVGSGILLAIGACYVVRAYRPVAKRRSIGLSLLTAFLTAWVVAVLNRYTHGLPVWGGAPVQVQMFFAGLFSQFAFELVARRGEGAADKVADKLGIPE